MILDLRTVMQAVSNPLVYIAAMSHSNDPNLKIMKQLCSEWRFSMRHSRDLEHSDGYDSLFYSVTTEKNLVWFQLYCNFVLTFANRNDWLNSIDYSDRIFLTKLGKGFEP